MVWFMSTSSTTSKLLWPHNSYTPGTQVPLSKCQLFLIQLGIGG